MRIPIPFISIQNFGDSINSFFRIWNIIEENKNKIERIVLDFSNCKFSSPFLLLSIHLIYKKLKSEGVNIELKFHDDLASNFNLYLTLICFSKGLSLDGLNDSEIISKFEAFNNKTYIPLTCVPSNNELIRTKVLETIGSHFSSSLNLPRHVWYGMNYLLDEAMNNIKDHASVEHGYIFSQYYRTLNFMDLCIADTGVSLLGSYQRIGRENILTHVDAMNAAQSGDSSKNDYERGFGINTSRRMLVNGMGGKYFYMSGNAIMTKLPNQEERIFDFSHIFPLNWQGTFLYMRIPTNVDNSFNYLKYLE